MPKNRPRLSSGTSNRESEEAPNGPSLNSKFQGPNSKEKKNGKRQFSKVLCAKLFFSFLLFLVCCFPWILEFGFWNFAVQRRRPGGLAHDQFRRHTRNETVWQRRQRASLALKALQNRGRNAGRVERNSRQLRRT